MPERKATRIQRSSGKGERLVAVFLLGVLLFNYPVLAVFYGEGELFDIPAVYVYIFAAWACVIALLALVVERRR